MCAKTKERRFIACLIALEAVEFSSGRHNAHSFVSGTSFRNCRNELGAGLRSPTGDLENHSICVSPHSHHRPKNCVERHHRQFRRERRSGSRNRDPANLRHPYRLACHRVVGLGDRQHESFVAERNRSQRMMEFLLPASKFPAASTRTKRV